jgi:hypothetical protein
LPAKIEIKKLSHKGSVVVMLHEAKTYVQEKVDNWKVQSTDGYRRMD